MLGAALLSALPPAAAAAQASPGDREVLTTAAQVRGLSMDEASSGLPVRLEAVVTFYHHPFGMLFVRDTTGPLFVFVDRRTVPFPIHAGQRVALEARTVAGTFAPALAEARIQPLDEVGLPKPVPATLGEIATGTLDSEWVEVEGVVRSAAREGPFVRLNLQTPEGSITTRVLAREGLPLDRLVDSRVRAQGACGSVGSNRRQLAGALLWVPDAAHLVVEAPPPTDPFALEATPLASLMRFTSESPARHRAKVSGVVTLQQPGEGLFLQERDNAAYVETSEPIGLRPGDRVEAVGFPTMGGSSPVLKEGLLRRVRGGPEPRPLIVGAERARQGAYDGLLVTITGQLSDFVSSSNDLVLVLAEGQRTFSARLRGRAAGQAAILALAPGSLLRLTGVCVAVGVGTGEGRGFELLLRSSDDVAVLGSPSWWTASRVQLLLGATAVTFVAILGWVV
ncbi:MAG TPA: hypothetical protein VIC87_10195, partial [Vicinamibacteria bacterium]